MSNNDWILTKNAIPDDGSDVVVYCQDGTYRILWYALDSKDWNDIDGYVCEKRDVVAWIPLPEIDIDWMK